MQQKLISSCMTIPDSKNVQQLVALWKVACIGSKSSTPELLLCTACYIGHNSTWTLSD